MVKPTSEFRSLIKNARDVAFAVASELGRRGHRVRIVPSTISPNVEERWQHTDDGDLEITQRIEVKHWPNIDFQSQAEVPYQNVIVDEVYKLEKSMTLPCYAYVIVNASLTAALFIPIWSRPFWFKKKRWDRREGDEREFYFCPVERTMWLPFGVE